MRLNKYFKYSIFVLSLVVFSCSLLGSEDKISVTNHHSSTVFVAVWDFESSNTVDPAPAFPVESNHISAFPIKPAVSSTLSKNEIQGDSDAEKLRLFLWEVKGDSAYYQKSFTFTSQEINIRHGADGYFVD